MATYKEFQEALAADEELQARCIELEKEYDPQSEDEALEAKRQIAAKLGFDVPASEFRLERLAAQELDDEQLDMVAGGANPKCVGSFKHCDEAEWCHFDWGCMAVCKHSKQTCEQNYECVIWHTV